MWTSWPTSTAWARGWPARRQRASTPWWPGPSDRWESASSRWAKFRSTEARGAFREQIAALNEEGVDLIILETFGYLEELHQAMLAAREVNPQLPVVAQVTIDEDGNCLDGSTPEHYGPQIEDWGADVVGCNCSVGPVAMLDAMERVRAVTTAPLSAQPNAGMPRSVEGRNIYLCSPEYMASYARRFVEVGVRLVGGCCGTTPEHIHGMKAFLRVVAAAPWLASRLRLPRPSRSRCRRSESVRNWAARSPTASSSPWWRSFRPRAPMEAARSKARSF